MLAATLVFPAAYSPSPFASLAAARPRTAAAPAMSELSLAATVVRDVSALPTMYALMSLNEYMTHRYFQHLEFNRPESLPWVKSLVERVAGVPAAEQRVPGDGHVEHHAETYDDMSLKNDERWRANKASQLLDGDYYRGTAFHWSATLIMTVQMLPSVLPTYALMGWSLPETFAILLPSMLLHAVVWNAIHPPMHGLPPVALTDGFGTGPGVAGGKAEIRQDQPRSAEISRDQPRSAEIS